MNAQVWIAILVGVAAMADDIARRRIANWIPAAALAGGWGWQVGQRGVLHGSAAALAGATVGFVIFLFFYLRGGMGGGDVKLMTGFGALLGWSGVLWAGLFTGLVGGLFAVCVVAFKAVWRALGGREKPPLTQEEKERRESIPYAPAITLGVWLALVPKG
jgi:prepilin peptidase CpaA